ncbi:MULTISPECIES: lipid-A-disaccharide synthase [unclassified Sulfurospirillum]|uniref:lipid-A-disaccharide synthase n=1 Tax=unclassified Sulfurospirillum TaxID=2618290 RepID=UPI000506786D|nr:MULTISPECIES: lipid-A-disaccharide synthase [unclassified Sulfurospirillum]KFL34158.1 ipid-A-disaccharide synthase [Sulfurospirillum sp. SCADC]
MKLLVSALEPSANLHLEPILNALERCEIYGIFDERFGKPLMPSRAFSIMGFLDALPKIRKAKKAIKIMARMSFFVDKVLLIDSPAFNLPLAKAIKTINPNVEIIYYILPKVWAWKPKRVEAMEKYCTVLASIFPFEQQFYTKATYVGNPLLDEIPLFKLRYEETGIVSFFPGSRKSEIRSLFPIYKELASKIEGKEKWLVIPAHYDYREIAEIYGDIHDFKICRNTYEALERSEFAFVCSGTATLEAALVGVPFVLAYKAKALDYWIAKQFVKLKHVGLANIIFDFENKEPLHEELLQEEVHAQRLFEAYENVDREAFFSRITELRKILGHGSQEAMISIMKIIEEIRSKE